MTLIHFNTGDVGTNKDKVFKVDGSQQTIVWAIGPLNTKMEAAKHYNGKRQSSMLFGNYCNCHPR